MAVKTGSERDLATMLFKHIADTQWLLEKRVPDTEPIAWDSELAARLDDLAQGSGYRIFRHDFAEEHASRPEVFVIGYQLSSIKKTISYLEAIARKGLLQDSAFLAEGYDGTAPMLSRVSPVTNAQLNGLYEKYRITPRGKDSFRLREEQYTKLKEILENPADPTVPAKIQESMACLLERERNYFLPTIVEHASQQPVIFLTTMAHALSFSLPQLIKNNGFGYAVFVPNGN